MRDDLFERLAFNPSAFLCAGYNSCACVSVCACVLICVCAAKWGSTPGKREKRFEPSHNSDIFSLKSFRLFHYAYVRNSYEEPGFVVFLHVVFLSLLVVFFLLCFVFVLLLFNSGDFEERKVIV